MDTVNLAKWVNKELSSLLECEISDEYSESILKIETEKEIRGYFF